MIGKVVKGGPKKISKGSKLTKSYLIDLPKENWFDIRLQNDDAASQMESITKDN